MYWIETSLAQILHSFFSEFESFICVSVLICWTLSPFTGGIYPAGLVVGLLVSEFIVWPAYFSMQLFVLVFLKPNILICVSSVRAREEYFNCTAAAVSIRHGINATHSDPDNNLSYYLNIYAGQPFSFILESVSTNVKYCRWLQSNPAVLLLGLTAAAVAFGYARVLGIFHGLVKSSQILHNSMFSAVIRTPVRFFDVNPIGERCFEESLTPKTSSWDLLVKMSSCFSDRLCFFCFVGRILNRFSKDISQMDSILPITFVDFYQVRNDCSTHWIFTLKHLCIWLTWQDLTFLDFLSVAHCDACRCSYFYRTLAWLPWQPQSSLTSSSLSFLCCFSSCTWDVSTSAHHETSNGSRL